MRKSWDDADFDEDGQTAFRQLPRCPDSLVSRSPTGIMKMHDDDNPLPEKREDIFDDNPPISDDGQPKKTHFMIA